MRVYIAPCGIGLGHITRCEPIGRALENQGASIYYSTYLDGLEYAKRNNLPTLETVPISFKVRQDGTIDFKMTAATSGFSLGIRRFLMQIMKEIENIRRIRPSVVLSDSRASSLLAARLLGVPTVLILNQFHIEIVKAPSNQKLKLFDRFFFLIANIGWIFIRTMIGGVWARSNYILIPDLPFPYTISLGNLKIPERYHRKVILIGPITTNAGLNPNQKKLKRQLGFRPEKPVIYAAVSGPKIERRALEQKLEPILRQLSLEYQVVLSRGDPSGSTEGIREANVTAYDWLDNQDDFLAAADLVISRAGHGTIMKTLALGKPMVLIPIPDHTEQYGNARRAAELQVAGMIEQSQLNTHLLCSQMDELLNGSSYKEKAQEIGEASRQLNAVEKAVQLVTQLGTRRHSGVN